MHLPVVKHACDAAWPAPEKEPNDCSLGHLLHEGRFDDAQDFYAKLAIFTLGATPSSAC
jgi:hypothetical protein